MPPKLYLIPPSPPVRAVKITAKALGITLEEIPVDFLTGEHLKPEFLKLNPQHTVPVLVDDDGFVLWDSHAINVYLVTKYGKNDALYPKDIKKRALVDQRLHFDSGVAFAKGVAIIKEILLEGKTSLNSKDVQTLNEVYGFVEAFLEGKPWIAGEALTIADYSLYTTLGAANVLLAIDENKYQKLSAWYKKVDALPEAEVSKAGLTGFADMIKSKLNQ